jgi:Escherichia/Staphylococcus phage prohead protease
MTATDPETVVLVRSFELPLADGWDGRTLDVRVVPYNVPTTVADPPRFMPYQESFLRGAFEKQLTTPGRDRVWLNVEHEQGFRGAIGRSLKFADQEDGLHGSFGVLENADGDKALSLIRDGFLTGLSLEFKALASRRLNGVVERVRAQLDAVSLCRFPAYAGAEVLAMREEPDELPEPAPVALPDLTRSADVDHRLAALGFEPLLRVSTTGRAWDGSPARFTDEQYKRSTLLCRGTSDAAKADCSLPVLEPDGTLNVNALGAAAAALAGGRGGLANVTGAMKAAAARKLIRYYNQAGLEPPQSLRAIAGSA